MATAQRVEGSSSDRKVSGSITDPEVKHVEVSLSKTLTPQIAPDAAPSVLRVCVSVGECKSNSLKGILSGQKGEIYEENYIIQDIYSELNVEE